VSVWRAPAALPVACGLLGAAAGLAGLAAPVLAVVGLVGAACAWRGRWGSCLGLLAVGFAAGAEARPDVLRDDPLLVVEAEGRICGAWRRHQDFPSHSARFCADWLGQGERIRFRPPTLRLDLPEGLPRPPYGALVRARGTLTRFPGFANEIPVPPGPWRLRVKSGAHLRIVASAGSAARASGILRARLDAAMERASGRGRPGVAMARAFVLGDEDDLSEDRRRALRRTGLAHLVAVSGANLTLVALLVGWLAAWSRRPVRLLAPAAAVLVYLAAVGPEPSVLRAGLMAGAGFLALFLRRQSASLQALALAAAALVALDPRALSEVGFQLSFGATLGLVLLTERWRNRLAGLPHPLAAGLAASAAAQAGSLPWSAAAFGEVTPLAPLWNLIAVPWSAVAMIAGLLWTLGALLLSPLAGVTASTLDLFAWPFAALERLPPGPWLSIWWPGGALGGLLAAGLLAAIFEFPSLRGRILLFGLALSLEGSPPPRLAGTEVVLADVGQGDAALVRQGSATLLVDGGGLPGRDLGGTVLRPLLSARGLKRIDAVVVSHADRDHCRGLIDLAALVHIGAVFVPAGEEASPCASQLAERSGRAPRGLTAGERLRLGEMRIEVLHPPAGGERRGTNAASLVLAIESDGRRLLLPGDLPAREERALVELVGSGLASDLLKVSHHGSASSSDPIFLAAVSPRLAVVSAGARNPFGHPSPAALARLHGSGALVLRTDRDGGIVLRWRRGMPWRIQSPGSPRAWRSSG
jgi:competence protein ComEC